MAERTQAELAYNELSHRILILEIAPNDRIREEFWAEKLKVNRSAIRESLTRLLGEGLVYQGERGGFFVSEMTDHEIHELREVREVLETAALEFACERVTPKQVKELEETCNDFANFVKKNYFTAAHEADFADAAHLTRTFYQMFGIPPSAMMRGEFFQIPSPFSRAA